MNQSEMSSVIEKLRSGLIVSCQATAPDVLYGPAMMASMAQAAAAGEAVGIRANGPADIAAIRRTVSLPIIGIFKQELPGLGIRITPSLETARLIAQAGADIIAVDATQRGPQEGRLPAAEFIRLVKAELGLPVMADISTFEEGVAAAEAGADLVGTTLSGYTAYSPSAKRPDFALAAKLAKTIRVPLVAEGRISTPADARQMLDLGVYAVVVGSMITRPYWIAHEYVAAMRPPDVSDTSVPIIAVDIGGTKIAAGLSTQLPEIRHYSEMATQAASGGTAVLDRVVQIIEQTLEVSKTEGAVKAIGISTAGEPDSLGRIAYATNNLPSWIGIELRGHLEARFGLPVAVENDGQMAALAEAGYGAGRNFSSVLCLTLGTGLGTGFVVNRHLFHGARGAGPALGHIIIEKNGRPCTCGRHGCLEQYVNGAALIGEYNALVSQQQRVQTGEAILQAANDGNQDAIRAIEIIGERLGYGLGIAVNLLDPSIIVVGGGLARLGDWLLASARATLASYTYPAIPLCPIVVAEFGSTSGLVGAAARAQQLVSDR